MMVNDENDVNVEMPETEPASEEVPEESVGEELSMGAVTPLTETAVMPEPEAEAAEEEEREVVPVRQPHSPKYPPQKPYRLVDVVAQFAGCGRCSFFMGGYRAAFSEKNLEDVVAEIDDDTLILGWNYQLRMLVHRSYGVRVDIEYDHYEGRCPECYRQFVYTGAKDGGLPANFTMTMKPAPVV